MQPTAFTEEDIALLSTLADQIAIAIENARLFTETRSALAELQTLHRQYLQDQWKQVITERGKAGYEYRLGRLDPIYVAVEGEPAAAAHPSVKETDTNELWTVAEQGEPTIMIVPASATPSHTKGPAEDRHVLLAPITVRGQVIGILRLENPTIQGTKARPWSEADRELVKSVADQIGQALENARLLEETQRRAEREHLVSEITNKLRASNDPQVILETAIAELRQALRAKQAQILLPPEG
jgi:GAF domain-containing protein